MSKCLPKRRIPNQLPMHFGTADRHTQADSARNDNVAAVISSGEKVDQSEISVPSTPPAGQPEIHGVEEHQLQEGELPPLLGVRILCRHNFGHNRHFKASSIMLA